MVKKSKSRKKVRKIKSRSSAVQTLSARKSRLTHEVSSNDSSNARVEAQPMCNPILLWSNSITENISRTPRGNINRNEMSPEYARLKEYRLLATDYHSKGDQKFLERDFRGAYADFLCAMKILGEHGNISDEFGRDMKMLRSLLTKCFECYNQLIEKDSTHAFWYKRRAILLRDECHNYKLAYKGHNFVLFTTLMKEYRLIVAKEEVSDTIYCFRETSKMAWSLEKEKQRAKKPFLTSDWINLWALCPCDDILLEDLLSVREEDRNPQNKSTLAESAYKNALKQTARGYHSMVVDTLLDAYAERQGIYRSEAFLLLSLIYSQICDNKVDYYLDTFIVLWEVDQYKVPLPRRKQIFMRYMSLARALPSSPFENLDLSMFSSEEQAQFYTQTALTIILRLQLLGGTVEERVEMNISNLIKLENVENLCDRAIKADRQFLHTGMLREYTVVEIALIDNISNHSARALASLKEYIEAIQDKFKPKDRSFPYGAHFINRDIDEAIKYGMELEKDLLFPGFIASFLLENKCPAGENIDTENILNWIGKVEERLKDDPEYFRLYLNVTELYHRLDFNEEASVCANLAIKYWPAHIFEGRLEQLVRNAVVLEALMEAEKKLRSLRTCRILLSLPMLT
ncbi:hypothetical protein WUBG_03869 [Wuchereria bancrofti]|uniref:Uncharacterized protein n=1 Tax=Wuchereria bancrofti TaxID=6293 RepID=J9BDG2_WUCBA|nr:hypothetical protein WUBG_03869 [Wuchereria bancrofti]